MKRMEYGMEPMVEYGRRDFDGYVVDQ